MRVLLDENCPHALRKHLAHHKTETAAYAGFAGLKNGKLLAAAEAAGFEVLVTGDKTLQYEQNLSGRKIAIVCLTTNSWRLLQDHVERIVNAVDKAESSKVVTIECGAFVRQRKQNHHSGPK